MENRRRADNFVPLGDPDLERGPRAGSQPPQDASMFTWHHLTVSAMILVPAIIKWWAVKTGKDVLANAVDLSMTIGFDGFGILFLGYLKKKRLRRLQWFFDSDCRRHVCGGALMFVGIFQTLCTFTVYSSKDPNVSRRDLLGTLNLSRKSFLEGVLLEKLERINRQTTIVPTFSGIQEGRWELEFTAWDEHIPHKADKCNWREVTKRDNFDSLEFEWRYNDHWRYEQNDELHDGDIYSVECKTHNTLSIPTSQSGRPVIQLKGTFNLSLKCQVLNKDWNTEARIHWSTNIVLNSDSAGLHVNVHPACVVPEFQAPLVAHDAPGYNAHAQALAQLKEKFPEAIYFGDLLEEPKKELGNVWAAVQARAPELCVARLVFNRRGDLLLEFMKRDATASVR